MTAEVVVPAADPVPLLPSPDTTLPVVETEPVAPDDVVPPAEPDVGEVVDVDPAVVDVVVVVGVVVAHPGWVITL